MEVSKCSTIIGRIIEDGNLHLVPRTTALTPDRRRHRELHLPSPPQIFPHQQLCSPRDPLSNRCAAVCIPNVSLWRCPLIRMAANPAQLRPASHPSRRSSSSDSAPQPRQQCRCRLGEHLHIPKIQEVRILIACHASRPVATQKLTPEDSYQILVAQRKNRPTSPHLTIYRPQITWLLSSLTRITGVALSGSFYLFGTAYLAAPLLGWHLDSASMAAAFGSMPEALKVATKFIVALPFTFHSFNGIRHLVWDLGKQFTNAQVIRTGWTVVGLTLVSSLYLATMV